MKILPHNSISPSARISDSFQRVGLAGCRLSDGYLHFGHVNGCFISSECSRVVRYVFIIQDEILDRFVSSDYRKRLVRLFRSVKAIAPVGPNILIVRQTAIKPAYGEILSFLEEISPATLISDTNPKIANDDLSEASISDLVFPLNEVCNIFSLQATDVFFNDDNYRYVSLAKRLRKRVICRLPGARVVRPTLHTGRVGRIFGYNYKKMSKGNENAIRLGVSDGQVTSEVERLANRRWLGKQGVQYRIAAGKAEVNCFLPPNSPLQSFVSSFLDGSAQVPCRELDIQQAVADCQAYALALNSRVRNAVGDIDADVEADFEELEHMEELVCTAIRRSTQEFFG